MSEQWVYQLREQFPVASKTVFLDIAYENCGALFAQDAVSRFFHDWSDVSPQVIKAGGEGKGNILNIVADTRNLLANLLGGVDARLICYTKNTNEGINAILQGFSFTPGDNVVTNDQEHSSVIMPCLNLAEKGVTCKVAIADNGIVTPEMLMEQTDSQTRFVVVSHVQSRSGYKIDLPKLAELCHQKGIYLIVDAIQSLGFCPFDAKAWGIDAVASSCYKGLLGIEGIGFLYCSRELLDQITPVYIADNRFSKVDETNTQLRRLPDADARKLENSTQNFAGIYALHAGLKQLEQIGIDRISAHISSLFEMLYDGLSALGFTMITPRDAEMRCHSISIKCADPQALYTHFQSNGIFISFSAGKYVRLSIAPFTTPEDIGKALTAASLWKGN